MPLSITKRSVDNNVRRSAAQVITREIWKWIWIWKCKEFSHSGCNRLAFVWYGSDKSLRGHGTAQTLGLFLALSLLSAKLSIPFGGISVPLYHLLPSLALNFFFFLLPFIPAQSRHFFLHQSRWEGDNLTRRTFTLARQVPL